MGLTGYGGVAQLGEHLLCKQGVIGSIPIVSTMGVGLVRQIWVLYRGVSEFGVVICPGRDVLDGLLFRLSVSLGDHGDGDCSLSG